MIKPEIHTQRIGIVLSSAPGYSETFFRSKIKGLMDVGHQVVLFCSQASQNFDDCLVVLLPKQPKNSFKQLLWFLRVYLSLIPHLFTVIRFIRLERKDHTGWIQILKRIYTHAPIFKHGLDWLHFGFGTLALACENLAAANHAKMAVSFRGFDIGVYPIKHPGCYARLWAKVDKVHVISKDIADLVYQQGFNDEVPLVIITPAIDTHYFSISKQTSLFNKPIQLVTVARLHWKKGLDYTLEALAFLKKADVSFQYRIIGTGPETEALKFACYQLGLQEDIFFLGKLPHRQVKKELEGADIYLQYSLQEGFCNAVLEAQAMGLLCVVSDAEGLSENVLNGLSGWVVPKGDPRKLKDKIIEIINLPQEQKDKIRQQARERVVQEFNLQKQAQEFYNFYTT